MTTEEHIAELLAVSKLLNCYPPLIARTTQLIRKAAEQGLYFAAFMGLRTWAEQEALYAQGRTAPGNRVTNARGGQSWHNFGLAFDLVEDGDPDKAGVQWSWKNNADYLKLGALANEVGLEWGGFWKAFKDYPHVQLTAGLSLSEARTLYAIGGNNAVWAEIENRLKGKQP